MWSTVVTGIGSWSTEVKSTSLLGMLLLKAMLLVPATSSQVQLLPVGLSQL
ncbi:uncharacterized protein DS421_19g653130 [Arachis hypogaea]|uniref:Uncharacterized protein n=1 Tax=Arachis hypogaea TaxID=3818 RepID=A0A6B9V7V4_ARAHY|nr:uncharacterized protein DS421_19g653130 [Arachis hypogaea]